MIIVGLGNPGLKYRLHRHTVGHIFVDWIARHQPHSSWHTDSKKVFDYQKITVENVGEVIIVKTRTYMNESGKAVLSVLRYFNVEKTDQLLVVHDDLDLSVGVWKLDFAKGPKLHNGILSVESSIKSDAFWRLRIGVDNRGGENRTAGDVYVLQDFTSGEREKVSANFPAMWERIQNNNNKQ